MVYRFMCILALYSQLSAMEIQSLKDLCFDYIKFNHDHPAINLHIQDSRLPRDLSEHTDEKLYLFFNIAVRFSEEKLPYFFSHNVDINYQDAYGDTALHILARRPWYTHTLDLIQLVEWGADCTIKNDDQETPLDYMNPVLAAHIKNMNANTASALLYKVCNSAYMSEDLYIRTVKVLLAQGASMPTDYTYCIKKSYWFIATQYVHIKKYIASIWNNYIFVKV